MLTPRLLTCCIGAFAQDWIFEKTDDAPMDAKNSGGNMRLEPADSRTLV